MEETTLGFVTEIGTYGSMNIKDPTVVKADSLKELSESTKDPALKQYLEENYKKEMRDK